MTFVNLSEAMRSAADRMVWDYAADVAVPESEMPFGGERWKASERAKWSRLTAEQPSLQDPQR